MALVGATFRPVTSPARRAAMGQAPNPVEPHSHANTHQKRRARNDAGKCPHPRTITQHYARHKPTTNAPKSILLGFFASRDPMRMCPKQFPRRAHRVRARAR